jgi:hypothetical protein
VNGDCVPRLEVRRYASLLDKNFLLNIKQLFLLVLILAFYSPCAFAQGRNKPVDKNNLYSKALFASLKKFAELDETLRSKGAFIGNDCGERLCADYRNMIVEKSREITDGLLSQLGDYRVEYLDAQGLIDRYKTLNKELPILIAHPMENEGERLTISFTFHWFSYKKRSLIYAISDWSNVYFRYDCEKHEYVIDEVKLGGI